MKRLRMGRIYRGFLLVLLISALSLHVVYMAFTYARMERQAREERQRVLQQGVSFADRFLEEIEDCANILSVSQTLQQVLLTRQRIDYLAFRDCQNVLNEYTMAPFGIYRLDLYVSSQEALVTSSEGVFYHLSPEQRAMYENCLAEGRSQWMLNYQGQEPPLVGKTRNESYLTFVRPVVSMYTGKTRGVLFLSVKYREFETFLPAVQAGEAVRILYGQAELCGSRSENRKDTVLSVTSQTSGISFEYGYRFRWTQIFSFRLLLLIALITALFLISFLIIVFISERMLGRPIERLLYGFSELEKSHFEIRLDGGQDEIFGELYSGFEHMASHLQSAVDELVTEKTRGRELKQRLLQMQIRPHFLYNIFNNMVWMTEQKSYDTLEQLVKSTAGFYKTALNAGSSDIMLLENQRQLEYYVTIQKFRFGDRFDLEVHLDEAVEDQLIPNLLLQPLVENAIVHGMQNLSRRGRIIVTAGPVDGGLLLAVEDNGSGIDPERLRLIREAIRSGEDNSDQFFAMVNIAARLRSVYGDRADLQIQSEPDRYTRVEIRISGLQRA